MIPPHVHIPARRDARVAVCRRRLPEAAADVRLQDVAQLEIRLDVAPAVRTQERIAMEIAMMRCERARLCTAGPDDTHRGRRREPVTRRHHRVLPRLVDEQIERGPCADRQNDDAGDL